MKTKEFYLAKIAKAKSDINKWEQAIITLDNPIVSIKANEPTKIISFRVPVSNAKELKKQIIEIVSLTQGKP